MISFFKCCSIEGLRNKMIFVYVLNVTDIIFTLILCGTGIFIEANPFAALFTGSTAAAITAKSLIPGALLAYLYFRLRSATEKQRKKANISLAALLIVYSLINVSHLTWLSIMMIRPSLLV
jgi:hypothetical protein